MQIVNVASMSGFCFKMDTVLVYETEVETFNLNKV
jgi:hypothetical protein